MLDPNKLIQLDACCIFL